MDEWRAVAIDTLAGWAAGVVCTVAFQPVDTVLTRQQYEVRAAGAASVVLRQGGLWRGTAPLLALVPLQNALLMVGYGAGERWGRGLRSAAAEPPRAGARRSRAAAPRPRAVLRRVAPRARQGAAPALAARAARRRGVPGLSATFYRRRRDGVWFLARDAEGAPRGEPGRRRRHGARRRGRLGRDGGLGRGLSFDLLKTRIQGSPTPLSLTGAARDLLRREAAPGAVSAVAVLYRGLGLKLLRAVPSSGLNFFAYECEASSARWAV
ncbi:hypothetical protein JL722_6353 [Aureococcus anophagefferens]|nr:hypothetical protein JL722_6353 [Aureococcus anophagefferens]